MRPYIWEGKISVWTLERFKFMDQPQRRQLYSEKPHQKSGTDVKELTPEPLNRSLYDQINERYKGVWVLWPT